MYSVPNRGSTLGLPPPGGPTAKSYHYAQLPPSTSTQATFVTNHGDPPPSHHHPTPDSPDSPPHYPRLTLTYLLVRTLPILLLNLVLEALFAYILKFYGAKKVLLSDDRRVFNMASLLLAAALSMGIGYLLDQIGTMLRGRMMGGSLNTKEEIAHILRGTLGSYSLLIFSHLRRKAYVHATTLATLFILSNLLGRLSVGFLGLTYAVDDQEVEIIPALEGTWWPELGEPLRNDSVFLERKMEGDTFLDLVREVTTAVVPFPEVKVQIGEDGEPKIEDLGVWDVKLERMEVAVEDKGESSKVVYKYTLKDIGGEESIRVNRSIQVSTECTREEPRNIEQLKFSSTTFYAMKQVEILMPDLKSELSGWILHSNSKTVEDCGPSCTIFGVTEGITYDNILKPWYFFSSIAFTCHLSVTYDTPQSWGLGPGVAPSVELLHSLSSFLFGNGTRNDNYSTFKSLNATTANADRKWLTPWDVNSKGRSRQDPPTLGIAGVFARAVALVVQRLGDGLDKRQIVRSKLTAAGILSVEWVRVVAVLAGICVLQVALTVIGGCFVVGTLCIEDDLDLLDAVIARARFPEKTEESQVEGKPWVKGMGRQTGDGEVTYRFKGVLGRKRKQGADTMKE
ncbi:hypothetical protein BDZ91DRAFT_778654 [Kalaharituber pfeilii]|nr:hypothetical protein BDZ91DRAFT_778654 [Kalaharituber pfeilii]